ncbi:MAG TPA: hypothetical protein VFU55_07620 [Terracidiphilus sp.]|nr:hypothetical protein [Terracidiphilus sp.]
MKAVPELDLGSGESAQYWRDRSGVSYVNVVAPGEDFWAYTRYCFDKNGNLKALSSEFRTAWGWGFRTEGPVLEGVLHPSRSQFFNVKSGKEIARPADADDVSDAMNPEIYPNIKALPFANLLRR